MSQLHTKTDEIKAARASCDDACEALSNLRKSRDQLLQQAVDAKAECDEAKRTCDQIFYLDCEIDAVLEFSEKRLTGFEDSFDQAIEQLIEQHAAVKKATAEYTKKDEAYLNALKKIPVIIKNAGREALWPGAASAVAGQAPCSVIALCPQDNFLQGQSARCIAELLGRAQIDHTLTQLCQQPPSSPAIANWILTMTTTGHRLTRRNIFIGAAVSVICAPAIVRAASLMPARELPLQLLNPERRISKTVGEWYQLCFYNNLDNDLRAGRAMTYGPVGGKTISEAEAYRIVAQARAGGWLPPYGPRI